MVNSPQRTCKTNFIGMVSQAGKRSTRNKIFVGTRFMRRAGKSTFLANLPAISWVSIIFRFMSVIVTSKKVFSEVKFGNPIVHPYENIRVFIVFQDCLHLNENKELWIGCEDAKIYVLALATMKITKILYDHEDTVVDIIEANE